LPKSPIQYENITCLKNKRILQIFNNLSQYKLVIFRYIKNIEISFPYRIVSYRRKPRHCKTKIKTKTGAVLNHSPANACRIRQCDKLQQVVQFKHVSLSPHVRTVVR